MIPTPNQLFDRFERGEIERDELQAMMAIHARELIKEMEEDYQNPVEALLERLLAGRSARRLIRRHGSRLLREILVALSEIPGFPAFRHLWNASHPDVPLHCFLRMRREPVFRMVSIELRPEGVEVVVEHGAAGRGKATRQCFSLKRNEDWRLRVERSS